MSLKAKGFLVLVILSLGVAVGTMPLAQGTGKFYIIGMGTSPDLVTVRGAEIIKHADVFLLEEPGDREAWADLIGDREVFFCPHVSRRFYGLDAEKLADPEARKLALSCAKMRQDAVDRIQAEVRAGKTVAALEWGDAMMYGTTFYLELLPEDFPSEIVPGVGAFEASTAAVKWSPTFGRDTNSVILTMGDFPGRLDTNERLMETQTSMVFYMMNVDCPALFAQLAAHYPADTPVAVVAYAGDREKQQVIRSTVGRFLTEVDYEKLPKDMHMLLVGKFLGCGQARVDGLVSGKAREFIETSHPEAPQGQQPQ